MVNPVSHAGLKADRIQDSTRVVQQEQLQRHSQIETAPLHQEKPATGPKAVNEKELEKEIDKLNNVMKAADQDLRFKFHKEAETLFVELVDVHTQEVIKSLPPEYMLELSAKMKELIGLFIDKKF